MRLLVSRSLDVPAKDLQTGKDVGDALEAYPPAKVSLFDRISIPWAVVFAAMASAILVWGIVAVASPKVGAP